MASKLSVLSDQFGALASAALLAGWTARLVRQAVDNSDSFLYGLYHFAAERKTSWQTYECYVIECACASDLTVRGALEAIKRISVSDFN